ncbi:MAG TPA: hypothetical protein VGD62_03135 [Acidobacteriaceae bacterium]
MAACLLASLLSGCGVDSNAGRTGAAVAAAQGPQLGYLWSPEERSLRPILGVPGASQIGQSVVPPGVYVNAAVAASLALLEEPAGFDLMTLPSGAPVRLAVPAPGTATAQIRLSPGGTSAALFVPGATTMTVVTGLSAAPAASQPGKANQIQNLTAAAPIEDAAVSDAGSAAVLTQQAGGMALAVLSASGRSTGTVVLKADGGLQFVGASDDLLVADAAANTLTLVRDASTLPAAALVATGTLLKAPLAVAASSAGRWAVVANSAEASVVRVDLTGQTQAQRVVCACKPTTAVALGSDGYFRVTTPTNAPGASTPAWMVDATAATPRMLFIPALAGPAGAAAKTAAKTAPATATGTKIGTAATTSAGTAPGITNTVKLAVQP